MTSTDTGPTLLPGISARAWQSALHVTIWITSLLMAAVLAVVVFTLVPADDSGWLVAAIATYGFVYVEAILLNVRGKEEAAAGYTTLPRAHPTLPQLDPSTGGVVRRAGDPYLAKSRRLSRRSEGAADRSSTTGAPPSRWAGPLMLLPSFLIAVVGMSFIFAAMGAAVGHPVEAVFTAIVVVIALYLIVVAVGGVVVRGRLARLRVVAANDFVFVFAKVKGYEAALDPINIRTVEAPGYTARGASANDKQLTIWEGNPPVLTATIRWDAVTSVQVDTAPRSNISNTVALVTFKTGEGNLVGLPLASPRSDSFPTPSKSGVRWVVDQLNTLRTSTKRL